MIDTLILVATVVAPRGEPVTITVTEPVEVPDATAIVSVLDAPAAEGVTLVGLNEVQVTPVGRGATQESVTETAVPEIRVALTDTVPD